MPLKAEAPLRFNAVFFHVASFQSKPQHITISLYVLKAAKRGEEEKPTNPKHSHYFDKSLDNINVMFSLSLITIS